MHSSAPYAYSRGPAPAPPPQQYGRPQLGQGPKPQQHQQRPPAKKPAKPYYPPLQVRAPPAAPAAPMAQAMDVQPGEAPKAGSWTPEQLKEAKDSAQDLFDAPLNESGKHRVRVTTYGPTIGVDIRDFFLGTYGELTDKWLPGKKGIRLRPEEWTALKAVSGDVDAALAAAGYVEQPVAPAQ